MGLVLVGITGEWFFCLLDECQYVVSYYVRIVWFVGVIRSSNGYELRQYTKSWEVSLLFKLAGKCEIAKNVHV